MIIRLRDSINKIVPRWLKNRVGKNVGYRFFWAVVAPLDALLDMARQAFGAMLGLGTPTALPLIGRGRGLIRNRGESQTDYAKRLRTWLDVWPDAASGELIATAVHNYIEARPRVRVIQRGDVVGGVVQPSTWITVDTDGTMTTTSAVFDWDSVSHPSRSDPANPYWSDLFVVVYAAWPVRSGTTADLIGDDGFATGHMASNEEVQELHLILAQWKGAHSCIRAVIYTADTTQFNPADPSTNPDGKWGAWGIYSGTSYVASDRDPACRFWEPR